jgi:transposase-like protein
LLPDSIFRMLPVRIDTGVNMSGDTEFWTSHVDALQRESVAVSIYARRHGLALASLYYWRRKLKMAADAGAVGAATGKFVALRLVGAAPAVSAAACTLLLGSGLRLEMTALPSPHGWRHLSKPVRE